MSYLLDTCVVSELVRPEPDSNVVTWIRACAEDSLYLSVLTVGEIQKGVSRLEPSRRRTRLERWLREDLRVRFGERLLPVDERISLTWGRAQAELEAQGTPMSAVDGLIAATARAHGLALATRNTGDFRDPRLELVNPWLATTGA